MEAILYLLLTTPSNSTINIYLDNKTTINYLKSLADTTTTQRKNWDIIHIINQILTKKHIQLTTHKVKSHSNNYLHNQADLLAKQGTSKPIISIDITKLNFPIYFQWHQNLIPFKLRTFIKNIITIKELYNFSQLKYLQNLPKPKWSITFSIINSLEYNPYKYSLRIKIITNNLPTMQNLSIRYPHLYSTPNCTRCQNLENTLHLLTCPSTTHNNINILTNIISDILLNLKLNQFLKQQTLNILLTPQIYSLNNISLLLFHIIIGYYQLTTFNNLQTIFHKQTEILLTKLSNLTLDWFHQDIWTQRNFYQHQWETARNITFKTKKKKISFPTQTPSNLSQIIQPQLSFDISDLVKNWFLYRSSLTTCI